MKNKETKHLINEMKCVFPSYSVNESLARSLAFSFVCQANPTVSELADIKCAVSEAVTNAAVHAYRDTIGLSATLLLLIATSNWA